MYKKELLQIVREGVEGAGEEVREAARQELLEIDKREPLELWEVGVVRPVTEADLGRRVIRYLDSSARPYEEIQRLFRWENLGKYSDEVVEEIVWFAKDKTILEHLEEIRERVLEGYRGLFILEHMVRRGVPEEARLWTIKTRAKFSSGVNNADVKEVARRLVAEEVENLIQEVDEEDGGKDKEIVINDLLEVLWDQKKGRGQDWMERRREQYADPHLGPIALRYSAYLGKLKATDEAAAALVKKISISPLREKLERELSSTRFSLEEFNLLAKEGVKKEELLPYHPHKLEVVLDGGKLTNKCLICGGTH